MDFNEARRVKHFLVPIMSSLTMLEESIEGKKSKQMGNPREKAARGIERFSGLMPQLTVDGLKLSDQEKDILPRASMQLEDILAIPEEKRKIKTVGEMKVIVQGVQNLCRQAIEAEKVSTNESEGVRNKIAEVYMKQEGIKPPEK